MYPLTEAPKKINFVLNEELHSGKKSTSTLLIPNLDTGTNYQLS